MLDNLRIKNVALIEDLSLQFDKGFNVLMGETGAGKSIILDALDFVLGTRADKSLIMTGKDKMFVEAIFSNLPQSILLVLSEYEYDSDDVLVISRSLNQDGKSEIRVNGNISSLSILKNITKNLVDSYSQHENTFLLKSKNHLSILDEYKPNILIEEKKLLKNLLQEKLEIQNQIQMLLGKGENRERYLELLKFQIDEIENLNPKQQEEDELSERYAIMQNSEKISSSLDDVIENLDSSQQSAIPFLKVALRALSSIQDYNEEFSSCYDRMASCIYELDDLSSQLKHLLRSVKFDEKEFDVIDSKLDAYRNLKKKYGVTIDEVLQFLKRTKTEYDNLLDGEEKLNQLNAKLKLLNDKIDEVCSAISEKRKELSVELENKISYELKFLGMKNAQVSFAFERCEVTKTGFDQVEMLFSANKGETLKSLSKIISGGEMSRFMLALKTIVVSAGNTFVFDEIDSGISGETGQAVGERIAKLSLSNQVILISHLPQVCSMADKFFFVYKSIQERTLTNVRVLIGDQVYPEIARLSGGDMKSNVSILHAKEMITRAITYKSTLSV